MPKTLQTKWKTCFRGSGMILYALTRRRKKYILKKNSCVFFVRWTPPPHMSWDTKKLLPFFDYFPLHCAFILTEDAFLYDIPLRRKPHSHCSGCSPGVSESVGGRDFTIVLQWLPLVFRQTDRHQSVHVKLVTLERGGQQDLKTSRTVIPVPSSIMG